MRIKVSDIVWVEAGDSSAGNHTEKEKLSKCLSLRGFKCKIPWQIAMARIRYCPLCVARQGGSNIVDLKS